MKIIDTGRMIVAAMLTLMSVYAGASAQTPGVSVPDQSTNRRYGYLNDASAVGWNPSMLGTTDDIDLLMSVPYSHTMFSSSPVGLFGKLGPIAAGVVLPMGDSNRVTEYYAGFGMTLSDRTLWGGVSARWFYGNNFFRNGEFALGLTWQPVNNLFAGLSLTNLLGHNGGAIGLNADASYPFLKWLTGYIGFNYNKFDTLGGKPPIAMKLGLGAGVDNNRFVLTAQYDINHGRAYLGAELLLNGFGGGIINQSGNDPVTGNYISQGGAFLFRYTNIEEYISKMPDDGTEPSRTVPRTGSMGSTGWAADRAYKPASLFYRIPTNDAGQTLSALTKPCTSNGTAQYDTPEALVKTVAAAGPPYTAMSGTLEKMSPDPKNIYSSIRKEYYSSRIRSREISVGDSLQLVSKQGYSIGIQAVDPSGFPDVSVIMQVTDATGKNVKGLGKDDFAFRDPSLKIISVKPIDSTLNIPVDIVLLIDCSGSMSEEIAAVRARVESFVKNIEAKGVDSRLGGVLYGGLIYDTLHPTSNFKKFREFARNAAAIGSDEITSSAIKEATTMNFRPNAQRIFVMITDDWAIQENSRLNEPDLVQALWNTGARLYSIIEPCKNNSAVLTRLTLGKEYDIRLPFTSILNEIGTDITTTYQLVYRSKLREPLEKVTMLRGKVKDELGRPVGLSFPIKNSSGDTIQAKSNPTTGDYMVDLPEGTVYKTSLNTGNYIPLNEDVDMKSVKKGDTAVQDFTLMLPPTVLSGQVTDEKGVGQQSEVEIDNATTLKRIATVRTDATGHYETLIKEGQNYRLAARKPDYIPTPADLNAVNVEKGTRLKQDLKVITLDEAIRTGATFKLQNIFFDYDKWELKPESLPEIDRLVNLMKEYGSINVEISAHTDGNGSDDYNRVLSEKRAKSVVDYLITQGVVAVRLRSKGFGKSMPIASNDTEEGRAQNRRVEFRFLK